MADRRFRLRLKAKAEGAAEGEAPCKAPRRGVESGEASRASQSRVEDASSISDERLHAEVQAILATDVEDLSQTTLGQVRRALEERLGLSSGSLGKKKQLRRKVSRIVHDEVIKKVQRSQSCDRVVRALVEFEGYPDEVRRMLINCLPLALSETSAESAAPAAVAPTAEVRAETPEAMQDVSASTADGPAPGAPSAAAPEGAEETGEAAAVASESEVAVPMADASVEEAAAKRITCPLHPHQVRLLGIVRDALSDSRAHTAVSAGKNLEKVKLVESEICAFKVECAAAAAAQATTQARADAAAGRLKDLEREVGEAAKSLARAEVASQGAREEEQAVNQRRNIAECLRDGPLQVLLDGAWKDEKERDVAIASVLPYFKEEGADDALVLAAPATLKKRPHERSPFDNLAARSMKQHADERIAAADVRLAAGIQSTADTEQFAAGVILEATRARFDRQIAENAAAQTAAAAAVNARKVAEATLAKHWMGTKDLCAEGDHHRAKLQELDDLLAMIDRWIAIGSLAEAAASVAPSAVDEAAGAGAGASAVDPAVEQTEIVAPMEVCQEAAPAVPSPAPESEPAAASTADPPRPSAAPAPVCPGLQVEETCNAELLFEAADLSYAAAKVQIDCGTGAQAFAALSPASRKPTRLVVTPGKSPIEGRPSLDGATAKRLGA